MEDKNDYLLHIHTYGARASVGQQGKLIIRVATHDTLLLQSKTEQEAIAAANRYYKMWEGIAYRSVHLTNDSGEDYAPALGLRGWRDGLSRKDTTPAPVNIYVSLYSFDFDEE